MISILRKNQQVLMVMITILVIIAFVWLYNGVQWDKMGEDRVATVYGRTVTMPEFERSARMFHLAGDLGLVSFAQALAGIGPNPGEDNFVWNLMVLAHEGDELQIRPTDERVAERIQALPVFQTDGRFDLQKYGLFVEQALGPRGFTEQQLQEVVRDDLRVEELKQLVGSTISTSPEELRDLYGREYGKVSAAVVRLDLAEVEKSVEVTDEDVRKAFEERKESLLSDELRRVQAVSFDLSEADAKKEGRERIQALQAAADRAQDFRQKLLAPDATFAGVAKAEEVEVTEMGPFGKSSPPEALSDAAGVVAGAFELTPDQPNSDVLQAGDRFYVLHLEETVPSRPLSYEEAEPRLRAELRMQRATEKLNLRASEARQALSEALAAGKTLAEAATAAGVAVEDFPEFSMAEPKFEGADSMAIMQSGITMKKGELSQPIPTTSGALLVYIKERPPVDEQKFAAEKGRLSGLLRHSKGEVAFAEWLRLRRAAADVQRFGRLR